MKKLLIFLFAAAMCYCMYYGATGQASPEDEKHHVDVEVEKSLTPQIQHPTCWMPCDIAAANTAN